MKMLTDSTIKEFLTALSSSSPVPGGGSASALSGALSASLLAMVCNLTIGKEKFAAVERKAKDIKLKAEKMRVRFSALIEEDAAAFNAVIAAYKLPKATEAEKQARTTAVQKALTHAADVPLETARLALEALELSKSLVEIGNPLTLSDVGVSALLAECAVQGALLNVDINARLMADRRHAEELVKEANTLRKRSSAIRELVLAEVHERM